MKIQSLQVKKSGHVHVKRASSLRHMFTNNLNKEFRNEIDSASSRVVVMKMNLKKRCLLFKHSSIVAFMRFTLFETAFFRFLSKFWECSNLKWVSSLATCLLFL